MGGSEIWQDQVIEGTINFNSEFGTIPDVVYIALVDFETEDSGAVTLQLPIGDGDANIELSEFYKLDMAGDLNFDGSIDILDLAIFAGYWLDSSCAESNYWCGKSDIDRQNGVNIIDFAKFASIWFR